MRNNLIVKIIKEFLFGIIQVGFGSIETNFGLALFSLLIGVVFLIIPDAEKPIIIYLFSILGLAFSVRMFYLSTKQIIEKHKK